MISLTSSFSFGSLRPFALLALSAPALVISSINLAILRLAHRRGTKALRVVAPAQIKLQIKSPCAAEIVSGDAKVERIVILILTQQDNLITFKYVIELRRASIRAQLAW